MNNDLSTRLLTSNGNSNNSRSTTRDLQTRENSYRHIASMTQSFEIDSSIPKFYESSVNKKEESYAISL